MTLPLAEKSETVRIELQNKDYLIFNILNSHLVFQDKTLSARKSREESLKFTLRFTSLAIKNLLNNPEASLFIYDDENALMDRLEQQHTSNLESKFNEEINEIKKSFNAAINFAIELSVNDEGAGINFLRLWREDSFDQIRQEYPTFDGPQP